MLKEIKLKNFKLHKDTKLEFGKITLFIGPNNSGKSSAIHAMQLLKKQLLLSQGAGDKFIDVNNTQFNDFIHIGENFFEIKISGEVPLKNLLLPSELEREKSFIDGDKVNVFSTYVFRGRELLLDHKLEFIAHRGEILEDKKVILYTNDYGGSDIKENTKIKKIKAVIEKGSGLEIFNNDGKVSIGKVKMNLWDITAGQVNFSALPAGKKDNEIVRPLYNVIEKIFLSPKQLTESFHFIYPIRGLEWQAYDIEQDQKSLNLNLDNISVERRAKSIANAFSYNRVLEDEIYEKIKDVVDVKFFAELSAYNKVRLVSKLSKKVGIPFLFEGLGSHQMLFMLLPIALAKSNETIFIEEPETHLHPKAQYELSKLFTEIAEKQEKQLVMTTHSEHIVFGFLNMVAKKKLKKDELRIYYFNEPKNGEAKVKELKVNEFGQVDGGLPGFFEAKFERLLDFLSEPEEEEK
jgi:AAA15 family ATPase/GTPase